MKTRGYGIVVLSLILLLGCTRVSVVVPQPKETGGTPSKTPSGPRISDPPEGELTPRRLRSGAALRSNSGLLVRHQRGHICATDLNDTPAVLQETDAWCWAASVQGVLSFHKIDTLQCKTVTKTTANNALDVVGQPLCCNSDDKFSLDCQRNVYTWEALEALGVYYGYREGPLTRRQIAGQICGNGPFIYDVTNPEGTDGHSIVVKDYFVSDTNQVSLLIDEHEVWQDENGQDVEGFKVIDYNLYAIGWHGGHPNNVAYNYLQMRKMD